MLLDGPDSVGIDRFLADYWQKKPLFIKAALPGFTDFLTPEELAGLACEDDVESRLVFSEAGDWRMKNGPFTERDFTFLPEKAWTLLVQSVDHWVPGVQSLLQAVPFLPAWRVDDIMVSYAATDGGVGPHFDYYDVFLIQGAGSRRWQVGAKCGSTTPVDSRSGLKILEAFEPGEEWILESGDALYIPAGLSHRGTAIEPGLSYSIGFRAPDIAELLAALGHHAAGRFAADIRYTDPALTADATPGEIDGRAMQQVAMLLQRALTDETLLLHSFGRLMTEPRLPELITPPDRELSPVAMAQLLQKGLVLGRHPASRFACHHQGAALTLFVNGDSLSFAKASALLQGLNDELQRSAGRPLNLEKFRRNEDCLRLLSDLYNQGYLVALERDEEAVTDSGPGGSHE